MRYVCTSQFEVWASNLSFYPLLPRFDGVGSVSPYLYMYVVAM